QLLARRLALVGKEQRRRHIARIELRLVEDFEQYGPELRHRMPAQNAFTGLRRNVHVIRTRRIARDHSAAHNAAPGITTVIKAFAAGHSAVVISPSRIGEVHPSARGPEPGSWLVLAIVQNFGPKHGAPKGIAVWPKRAVSRLAADLVCPRPQL